MVVAVVRVSERARGAMSNEQLERGLQASVKVYNLAQEKLAELGEAGEACQVSRAELVGTKRAAAAMNRALMALVRESHASENRLTLELHMLRGIMQREHMDREANRARVFELFRRYTATDDVVATSSAAGGGHANPLNAPSASAVAIDRALATVERLEQSVRELSPVGRVNVHGAGLLSAKLKVDAAAAAAAAPPPPSKKRPKPPAAAP